MIRVCVVSTGMPYAHGGAELRALRLTRYLRCQENMDAILVAWDHGERQLLADELKGFVYPIRLFFQNLDHKNRLLNPVLTGLHIGELFLRLGWQLFRLRNQFDVLHVIFAFSWFNLVAIPVAGMLGKLVVIEMTALNTDDPRTLNRRAGHPEKQIFPHRPLKYSLFLLADAFVSKNPAIHESCRQAGLPDDRLYLIASGVDTQLFHPPASPEEKACIRRNLGLSTDHPILLFIGRIYEWKGLHWLLSAMHEIVGLYPDVELVVAGPVAKRDELYYRGCLAEIEAGGLGKSVRFVGRVSNVDEYLKAADVFVLPTRHEGFSGAILEAMACGLPIVTSDIPEVSESQIAHGREGILVPVGDMAQLTAALITLLQNHDYAAGLGRAARQRVNEQFTLDVIGAQYQKLYHGLLDCRKERFGSR